MKKTITIGIHSGKSIRLSTYLKAWRTLRAMTEEKRRNTELKDSLTTWWPVTAQECLQQYIDSVHDRINLRAEGKCLIAKFSQS